MSTCSCCNAMPSKSGQYCDECDNWGNQYTKTSLDRCKSTRTRQAEVLLNLISDRHLQFSKRPAIDSRQYNPQRPTSVGSSSLSSPPDSHPLPSNQPPPPTSTTRSARTTTTRSARTPTIRSPRTPTSRWPRNSVRHSTARRSLRHVVTLVEYRTVAKYVHTKRSTADLAP